MPGTTEATLPHNIKGSGPSKPSYRALPTEPKVPPELWLFLLNQEIKVLNLNLQLIGTIGLTLQVAQGYVQLIMGIVLITLFGISSSYTQYLNTNLFLFMLLQDT